MNYNDDPRRRINILTRISVTILKECVRWSASHPPFDSSESRVSAAMYSVPAMCPAAPPSSCPLYRLPAVSAPPGAAPPRPLCSAVSSRLENLSPPMDDIKERQQRLLQRLESLQEHMERLHKKLASPVVNTKLVDLPRDIVVNVSPDYVPYSLLHLQKILGLNITCYTHSTVSKLTPSALAFNKQSFNTNSDKFNIKITLIWKDVGPNAELITSSANRVVVLGEVNILRYLLLAVPTQYSFSDSDSSWEVDSVLDACNKLQAIKNSKERDSILKSLSSKLGSKDWLSGQSNPNSADILMFSVVKQLQVEKSLLPNLKTWFNKFPKFGMVC